MKNIVGETRGKLYIEEYIGSDKIKGNLYLCVCECGMDRVFSKSALSQYKSCGCDRTRYGFGKTPENTVWRKMKERCYNKNKDNYSYYGGRGIKVCDRWLNDFEAFLYDMGERPTPKHQLDRIDSDGDYEPGNCRWVTKSENMINRKVKRGLSGHKNIYQRPSGSYRVLLSRNGVKYYSKHVETVEEAITIRDKMIQEYKQTGKITVKN